jgi:heptosyltransferase-2
LPEQSDSNAILIVGPAWVGDMVMAQALFKLLKQTSPEIAIDVVAPKWTLPLLARMPEVRKGIEMPVGHGRFGWGVRKQLGQSLRGQYERAIVLPNTWKSALVPWFAKIPMRTGFVGEFRYGVLNDARKLDKQKLPKTIERYVALGSLSAFLGKQLIPQPRLLARPAGDALRKLGLQSPEKLLAFCPGAEYGPAKQWPAQHFAQLAEQWLQKNSQGEVWIFGSEKDQAIGDAIRGSTHVSAQSRVRNLAGQTSLGAAIDLMALADAVVSNDSGLMHVAAALDRPLVAIFGSSDPHHTPPNGAPEKTQSLWLGLECSPCFKRECPLGHLDCLNQIFPEQVLTSLEAVA